MNQAAEIVEMLSAEDAETTRLRLLLGDDAPLIEREVAKLLNCSTRTVQRLVDDERLNPVYVAGKRQYPLGQVRRYIRTQKRKYD